MNCPEPADLERQKVVVSAACDFWKKSYSEIYMEMLSTYNCQHNFGKEEESWKINIVNLPYFKTYYKITIIKSFYYWKQGKHIKQWNRTEIRNICSHMQSIDFWQKC